MGRDLQGCADTSVPHLGLQHGYELTLRSGASMLNLQKLL
jgi:hypothetical protein